MDTKADRKGKEEGNRDSLFGCRMDVDGADGSLCMSTSLHGIIVILMTPLSFLVCPASGRRDADRPHYRGGPRCACSTTDAHNMLLAPSKHDLLSDPALGKALHFPASRYLSCLLKREDEEGRTLAPAISQPSSPV